MGFGSRASLAAILGFAAAFVVACGSSGSGLLSSAQSSSIASQLTTISAAVQAGHCGQATAASRELTNLISGLPSGIDQKLVENLGQGASAVQQLAADQCHSHTTSTPTVTSPTTTAPTSTPTQTVTHTQTTTPATTTTPPTTSSPSTPTATNGGGTGTSSNTTQGGGAPVGGATKTTG